MAWETPEDWVGPVILIGAGLAMLAVFPIFGLLLIAVGAFIAWGSWRKEPTKGVDQLPLFCKYCGEDLQGLPNACPYCGHEFSGVVDIVYKCSKCGKWVKRVDSRGMCGDCRSGFLAAIYLSPSSPHNLRRRIRI